MDITRSPIFHSGYYIQLGQPGFMWMFAALAGFGVFFVIACLHGRLR